MLRSEVAKKVVTEMKEVLLFEVFNLKESKVHLYGKELALSMICLLLISHWVIMAY